MTPSQPDLLHVLLVGVGATAAMDAWSWLLHRLGVPAPDFALVGRWVGHMARGRWKHPAIARAAPVRGENALGWTVHYLTGIAFAGLLLALAGAEWARHPTPLPALAVGLATVVAPLFVMQPAMGAGIAARRTAAPLKSCMRSVGNHAAFGVGLYLAAALVAAAAR